MRVGLFIDTLNLGGAESVTLSLASYLAERGHEPVLYHFGSDDLAGAGARLGIGLALAPAWYWYKKTYRLPMFAWAFSRQLVADRIDLLHSHLFGPIVAGSLACPLARIPHVGTLHDVYIVQQRPSRGRLLQLAHLLGTRLVCVAESMADYYTEAAHVPREALQVIRNGVDLERYHSSATRADQAVSERELRMIMVGRLDPIKRHDLLLDVLGAMSEVEAWHLDIVGDGPLRDELEARCDRLGIREKVTFLGQRQDVPELLARADVFLLISDSEGMSLSLVEALASGLPIVATPVGNNVEFVKDGWNGYVIETGNAGQLQAALGRLLEDRSLVARFGVRSRQMAGKELDIEHTMRSYLATYERLIEAHRN